jgi:hypothetical protein
VISEILEILGRFIASVTLSEDRLDAPVANSDPTKDMTGKTLAFVVIFILVFAAAVWRFAPWAFPFPENHHWTLLDQLLRK